MEDLGVRLSAGDTNDAGIAVIGGGWAGMAAAVELAGAGVAVTVYEAARTLGGRARGVPWRGMVLDNGLHLIVGAYSQTLDLIRRVGDDGPDRLLRGPLAWHMLPGFEMRAAALPAPLHLAAGLIRARGAGLGARLACMSFMMRMRRARYALAQDTTVAELLRAQRQHPSMVEALWYPLCLAALNTAPEHASAQVFLNVLRDSLAAGREASELLMPRVDLSALFPEPAAAFVEARGGRIRRGARVLRVEAGVPGFVVHTGAGPARHAGVVLAVDPVRAAGLLAGHDALAHTRATLAAFRHEPIATVYLRYERLPLLPAPMVGLKGATAHWLFDRERIAGQRGLLAAVISAGGPHQSLTHEALAGRVAGEIAAHWPRAGAPVAWRVIEEKRATFACVPGLVRPPPRTAVPGLVLAGDYTHGDYPATLEGAVRSGVAAARIALDAQG